MRWKSSRMSATAWFGALRSRLRSLCMQHRWTAALGQASPTAPQPGIAVDDRQHRRRQPARDEIVEAPLPRRERLACAQLQGEELFAPVDKDPDDAQHRDADDLPATARAQGEAVEVDVDHVEVGERACPPRLQAALQRGDDARHCALREGAALNNGWSAPRIRRVLPPARYVAITASLTSGIRR